MKLTELKIKNLKPRAARYLLSDGGGLSIAVMPTGEKYWYYRTWEGGKERKVSLGRWPDVGLKEARELRYKYKHKGRDEPVILSAVASEWYEARCAPVLSPKTLASKRCYMRAVQSALGGRDMKTLTPPDVVAFVRDAQKKRGPFAAHRARGVLSQIFQYAIAAGLVDWNPVQQIAGALTPLPPSQHLSVVQTPDAARAVLRAIDAYGGNRIARAGLLLLAYTFVRPGELAGARWPELDLEGGEWRIPPERMKMRREHVVPLSSQALALFSELRKTARHSERCFPCSVSLFAYHLRRMGFGVGKMTPHGFRGLASTLLNERGFPPDVIERQLAHVEKNAVRAAYNRAEYMDERRKMMQWWGDYVESLIKK